MTINELRERSNNTCELCGAGDPSVMYEVLPDTGIANEILICTICQAQAERTDPMDATHWKALDTAVWNESEAVKVMAWRMLQRLKEESWAADLLEQMYLDLQSLEWAKATGEEDAVTVSEFHQDAFGNRLSAGDTVVLTKNLDVKGSSINARQGTVVKNIRLDASDPAYIEGKIEGQAIMIKTIFTKKQS